MRSLEWLSAPHDLAERTEVYLESASELFMQSAGAALELLDRSGDPLPQCSGSGFSVDPACAHTVE